MAKEQANMYEAELICMVKGPVSTKCQLDNKTVVHLNTCMLKDPVSIKLDHRTVQYLILAINYLSYYFYF